MSACRSSGMTGDLTSRRAACRSGSRLEGGVFRYKGFVCERGLQLPQMWHQQGGRCRVQPWQHR